MTKSKRTTKRVSLNITPDEYNSLRDLTERLSSDAHWPSMTDVLRLAIGVVSSEVGFSRLDEAYQSETTWEYEAGDRSPTRQPIRGKLNLGASK